MYSIGSLKHSFDGSVHLPLERKMAQTFVMMAQMFVCSKSYYLHKTRTESIASWILAAKIRLSPLHCYARHVYHDWSQGVALEGATSFPCPAASGIHQGYILGSLLFIFSIHDSFLSPNTESALYAGD